MPINTFATIDDPSAIRGTFADGINAAGQIVGSFNTANSFEGFVRNSDGTFVTLNLPSGNLGTGAEDINRASDIVGTYVDGSGDHGYLFTGDPTGIGRFFTLDDPSATPGLGGTVAHGINDLGQIVGGYTDSNGSHGFLFRPVGRPGTGIGTYTPIDGPSGTSFINAEGINDSGQIVGRFTDVSGFHGFLLTGGTFIPLDDPFATQAPLHSASTVWGRSSATLRTPPASTVFSSAGEHTSHSTIPRPPAAPMQTASTTRARSSGTMGMRLAFTAFSWRRSRTRRRPPTPPRT
jgi:probable HAF family extracellular repeat protein